MLNRHLETTICVLLIIACLGLSSACWKTDEQVESGVLEEPTPLPMDLGRDDMAALPGANVDIKLLEQFPYFLRQESSMAEDEIFAYYDGFFAEHGWTVEASTDPLTESRIHRYQLGDELAFVSISELDGGRSDVTLSRRQLRDDEKAATNS